MKSFLPEKLVMIDCEMVCVNPERDALLQVAMCKLSLDAEKNQYKMLKKPLRAHLAYHGKPDREFHHKYLSHIFEACNKSMLTGPQLQIIVHEWLGPEWLGIATPTGDCISCDMDFLYHNKCLLRPDIVDDTQLPGTFHYEMFDLNPLKAAARTKIGEKIKPPKLLDVTHDALYDCVNQTIELNYWLDILLNQK